VFSEVKGLHEIGPQLRAAREARELSLEQAEEETKIRKKYLIALEEGTPEVIPGDVYVRGFLRSYANWLGLDGDQLLERYKEHQSGASAPAKAEDEPHKPAQAAARPVERPAVAETRRSRHKPGRSGLPLVLAGGVLVVAIAGYLLVRQYSAKNAAPPQLTGTTQTPQAGSVVGAGATPPAPAAGGNAAPGGNTVTGGNATAANNGTAKGAPGTTAVGTPASTETAAKVTLNKPKGEAVLFDVPGTSGSDVALQFAQGAKVWMRVTVDGKVVFEGNSTTNAHWSGKNVTIRLGNADGLEAITVNSQRFDRPLKGGPFTLTFAPKA
jgi:cytoskeletal protein RodZ